MWGCTLGTTRLAGREPAQHGTDHQEVPQAGRTVRKGDGKDIEGNDDSSSHWRKSIGKGPGCRCELPPTSAGPIAAGPRGFRGKHGPQRLPSPPIDGLGPPLAEACMQCWTGPSLLCKGKAPPWADTVFWEPGWLIGCSQNFSSLLALLAKLLCVGHKLRQMWVAGILVIKTNLTTSHTLRRLDSVMLPFLSPLMFN